MIKICKSTNKKTKGFGCGKESDDRLYGLCPSCKGKWILESPLGEKWFDEFLEKHRKKQNKANAKAERERMKQKKIEIMSPDKYRAKYVQPLINKIARFIDYGHPCIATGNYEGKMAGGHYASVGSNRTICLNLHNIFIQSFHSNSWKGGDDKKYQDSLKLTFSDDYFYFVDGLRQHKPLHLSKQDMIEIKSLAQGIANELEKNLKVRTNAERIELRNEINLMLNIYDEEFSVFKL